MIDSVADDYLEEVTFVAVAGKGSLDATVEAADRLFSDNLAWGLDDNVWDLYGIPGQPSVVLISQGVIVDLWFGETSESFLRERIDRLVSLSA